jgi:SAM-dependent methyltransferase
MRINVGCGRMPMNGWRNFDTSFSVFLAKVPLVAKLLCGIKLIRKEQYQFVRFIQANPIEYADATKKIPLPDESVEVIYNSHMLEHLDRVEVVSFLDEAKRVLQPGGIIRCVIPDVAIYAKQYSETGDANWFVDQLITCQPYPKTAIERLKNALIPGRSYHLWMYDGKSLCELLEANGFGNAVVLEPGVSRIANPEGLDLSEKVGFSAYVEAEKALLTTASVSMSDGEVHLVSR